MRTVQIALVATILLAGALLMHPSVKAPGPTYISGEVSGIWDLEGSPYVVIEDSVVHDGQQLLIMPGVEVRFDLNVILLVHGTIRAMGTEGNTILFTSNATMKDPGDWLGITISVFSSENIFEFTKIEYAAHGLRITEESSAVVRHSEISNNSMSGVTLVSSFAGIKDTLITNNNAGIMADSSELELIHSVVSLHPDSGLALSLSSALIESSEFVDNHNGILAVGSEVFLFNSTEQSTMTSIWMSDVSFVTTIDSFFGIAEVVFDGLQSMLTVQWTLKVRVLDMYLTGVPGATVTVEAKLVSDMMLHTGGEGWIETLVVKELVMTNTETVGYNPYFVNATREIYESGKDVLVNEPTVVTLKFVADLVSPEAYAGLDLTVDEDENVFFDASGSVDDDPDFLTTGEFFWTFYDFDGHYMEAGVTVSHVFQTPGIYTVELRAEDSFGNGDVDYLEVRVEDITDPTAVLTAVEETKIRQTVVLDASASTDNDPDFPDTGNFTWSIGIGDEDVVLYGPVVEYRFVNGGAHTIQLDVSDASGNVASEQAEIKVTREQDEFPYLPLAILALFGIAFAGIANTEAGKYWFLKFLILPLYSKLSKKDVLDHFIRGQIYGYLVVHPGDNYTTIKNNLDLTNGTLTYHLDVLEREGFVKSQLRGTRRFYYPKGVKMPDNGTGFPAIKEDIIRRVEETPGITIGDLAGLIGVSRQLTNYHLRALIQEGYVQIERKGMKTRCYPVERGPAA
jgi:predicted transcriptional regulator